MNRLQSVALAWALVLLAWTVPVALAQEPLQIQGIDGSIVEAVVTGLHDSPQRVEVELTVTHVYWGDQSLVGKKVQTHAWKTQLGMDAGLDPVPQLNEQGLYLSDGKNVQADDASTLDVFPVRQRGDERYPQAKQLAWALEALAKCEPGQRAALLHDMAISGTSEVSNCAIVLIAELDPQGYKPQLTALSLDPTLNAAGIIAIDRVMRNMKLGPTAWNSSPQHAALMLEAAKRSTNSFDCDMLTDFLGDEVEAGTLNAGEMAALVAMTDNPQIEAGERQLALSMLVEFTTTQGDDMPSFEAVLREMQNGSYDDLRVAAASVLHEAVKGHPQRVAMVQAILAKTTDAKLRDRIEKGLAGTLDEPTAQEPSVPFADTMEFLQGQALVGGSVGDVSQQDEHLVANVVIEHVYSGPSQLLGKTVSVQLDEKGDGVVLPPTPGLLLIQQNAAGSLSAGQSQQDGGIKLPVFQLDNVRYAEAMQAAQCIEDAGRWPADQRRQRLSSLALSPIPEVAGCAIRMMSQGNPPWLAQAVQELESRTGLGTMARIAIDQVMSQAMSLQWNASPRRAENLLLAAKECDQAFESAALIHYLSGQAEADPTAIATFLPAVQAVVQLPLLSDMDRLKGLDLIANLGDHNPHELEPMQMMIELADHGGAELSHQAAMELPELVQASPQRMEAARSLLQSEKNERVREALQQGLGGK